jgi:hypothetical protein
MGAHYELQIMADYFQITLIDQQAEGFERDFIFTPNHINDRMWTDHGMIIMFTERNMPVPVSVDVLDEQPVDDFSEWDHVADASIDSPTGHIFVKDIMGYDDGLTVSVQPGVYHVRMYHANLDKLSEDGLEGEDYYRVALWPGTAIEPTVLKRWEPKQK